jgi:hypothetical protein
LDDQQLLAYLDDPDSIQETIRHLEQCEHCREKARALDYFQKRMKTRLYRSTCPTSVNLGEFYLRMAPASQSLVIAQHLRECPHCASEISKLEEFLEDAASPATLISPIKVLFARLVSGKGGAGFQTSPALRGMAKELPIFEAEGVVVSIDLQASSDGQFTILGQLAAEGQEDQDHWTDATVELKQSYTTPLVATMDDLGAFTFEAIYPGSVQFTIRSQHGIEVQTEKVFIAN